MTTLQQIVNKIRYAGIVAPTLVNFGLSDTTRPPFVTIVDFKSEDTYDTSGPVIKTSTFAVHVFDQDFDDAEAVAEAIDDLLDNSTTVTATTMRCLQDTYSTVQESDYVFHVVLEYTLTENI